MSFSFERLQVAFDRGQAVFVIPEERKETQPEKPHRDEASDRRRGCKNCGKDERPDRYDLERDEMKRT